MFDPTRPTSETSGENRNPKRAGVSRNAAPPDGTGDERSVAEAPAESDAEIPIEDSDIIMLNPLLETFDFDDASAATRTLCCLPSHDGGKRQYALPNTLFERLQTFDGTSTCAEIRERWVARGDEVEWEKLKRFVSGYCLPKRLLVNTDSDDLVAEAPETRASYMAVQIPLLPAWLVDAVAARFTWLFGRAVAIPTALTAAFVLGVFLLTDAASASVDLGIAGFAAVAGLVVLGALIHEFGHATAGHCYDCNGVEIGCGWYIYFPVLYTDLSDTWKLPRMQRAVVDIAGLYFQGVFLAGLVALYAATGDPVYSHAVMLSGFSIVAALNPFLRLDGYWLLSDLGGIANLRKQSQQLLTAMVRRVAGERDDPWIGVTGWSSVVLVAYTVLSTLFFAWLGWRLCDMFLVGLVTSYPDRITEMINVVYSSAGWQKVSMHVVSVAWKTVFFVILGRFGYLLIKRAINLGASARRWLWEQDADSPSPEASSAESS